jgi:hypothetical protein
LHDHYSLLSETLATKGALVFDKSVMLPV